MDKHPSSASIKRVVMEFMVLVLSHVHTGITPRHINIYFPFDRGIMYFTLSII